MRMGPASADQMMTGDAKAPMATASTMNAFELRGSAYTMAEYSIHGAIRSAYTIDGPNASWTTTRPANSNVAICGFHRRIATGTIRTKLQKAITVWSK